MINANELNSHSWQKQSEHKIQILNNYCHLLYKENKYIKNTNNDYDSLTHPMIHLFISMYS